MSAIIAKGSVGLLDMLHFVDVIHLPRPSILAKRLHHVAKCGCG